MKYHLTKHMPFDTKGHVKAWSLSSDEGKYSGGIAIVFDVKTGKEQTFEREQAGKTRPGEIVLSVADLARLGFVPA